MAPTIVPFVDCNRTVAGIEVVDEAVATSTFSALNVVFATESKISRRYVIVRLSSALTGSAAAARTGAAGMSVRMNNAELPARIDAVSPEIAGWSTRRIEVEVELLDVVRLEKPHAVEHHDHAVSHRQEASIEVAHRAGAPRLAVPRCRRRW